MAGNTRQLYIYIVMLEVLCSNINNTEVQGNMDSADSSSHHKINSNVSSSCRYDEKSNSPRALTPERRGQDEKEKRKKKVIRGSYML